MYDRIVREHTQRIEAPPDEVFPLICPVREADWLDGWADCYELIYSESGYAEKDCVFRTFGDDDHEMIWTISRHDPVERVVEFVRVTPGLAASTLRVAIADRGGASDVAVTYTATPMTDEGADYAARRYEADSLADAVRWWETSMNHYLRTGDRLPEPAAH